MIGRLATVIYPTTTSQEMDEGRITHAAPHARGVTLRIESDRGVYIRALEDVTVSDVPTGAKIA